ncbi:MAG: fructose-6-phosphate aldolase [Alphaproteobacteria bacterium]|jgi:transaldolase|nr:fructose-6-phosphate aldolase [Candidatus Jidaibacter sp.]
MKLYIDTCDADEIFYFSSRGLVDGVTTNPSLIKQSGVDLHAAIKDICALQIPSVSVEVVATDYDGMMKEAEKLCKIDAAITIKIPLTMEGLRACKSLSGTGIRTNVTLCFSAAQAMLAAKAGATYVSLFLGRLDDIGHNSLDVLSEVREIFDNYPEWNTQILAASIRHTGHIIESAKIGADIATLPPKILKSMVEHPLTDIGINKFLSDWKQTNQTI